MAVLVLPLPSAQPCPAPCPCPQQEPVALGGRHARFLRAGLYPFAQGKRDQASPHQQQSPEGSATSRIWPQLQECNGKGREGMRWLIPLPASFPKHLC